MTPKICLRCDWQGDTRERTCPDCGERPLYLVGAPPSAEPATPEASPPEESSEEAPPPASAPGLGTPSYEPDPAEAAPGEVAPPSRSTRSAVAFVLTALVLTVTLGSWLKANEERSTPAASIAAVGESPAGDGSPSPVGSPGPGSLVRIDATTGEILASVPMPSPKLLAPDGDSVWVLGEGGTKLVHVDAATNAVSGSFDVEGASALAAAGGSVWLSGDSPALYRLAPGASTVERANEDVPSLGNFAPGSLVGAGGRFWMSWFPDTGGCCVMRLMDMYRIDPATGGVIATIEGATRVVASGPGFVWAAVNVGSTADLRLVRIDMETYATERIGALGFRWADLTVADGAVWATSPGGKGAIVRLDPLTGEVHERIPVRGGPSALVSSGGAVWASVSRNGTVARYDISTGEIMTIDVGGTPKDVVFAGDSIWVAVSGQVMPPNDDDYVLDLNTGVMTPLSRSIIRSLAVLEGPDLGPQYAASPDGSARLAFVGAGDEGSPQIFIAGIDGTGIRQVTHDPTGAASPAWSPDGTSVAYMGYGGGDVRKLFILDVATGGSTRITDVARVFENGLQFTPDGSSLVYTDEAQVLMTVSVATGQSTLLFGPVGSLDGAWQGSMSPNGSLVTYVAGGTDSSGVYGGPWRRVANADGTGSRTIQDCFGLIPAGTWSPDGSQIVCSMGPGNPTRIIVVDIATLDAERVAGGSGAIWLDDHTLLVDA